MSYLYYDCGIEIEEIVEQKKKYEFSLNISDEDQDLEYIVRNNPDVIKVLIDNENEVKWIDEDEFIGDWFGNNIKNRKRALKTYWAKTRLEKFNSGEMTEDLDLLPYYLEQKKIQTQIITDNHLPDNVQYVAGVDVAYNEQQQIMVGAIVVMNASSLEVVEEQHVTMDITFPYIPGLFSFREIPPVMEAYNKLIIKPDLIVCDGHGRAHPRGVGLASHLGVQLDVPTIGCAKSRLVGAYDSEKLSEDRSSHTPLIWKEEEVGVVLRTQNKVKPVFVSIGHKIDISSAIKWILRLCPQYRLPETTRAADKIVNEILKSRTEYDLYEDS